MFSYNCLYQGVLMIGDSCLSEICISALEIVTRMCRFHKKE